DRARRDRGNLAGKARGGRIDDDVEGTSTDFLEADTPELAEILECRGERRGALGRAVGDHQLRGREPEQRPEHPARCAPRAGLAGENAVNERREAVGDRVAHHAVLIRRSTHWADSDTPARSCPRPGPPRGSAAAPGATPACARA